MGAYAAELLRDAVHHTSVTKKEGMLERLFTLWFNGLIYNQIWEDPRVDIEALELGPESRVLTISSAGCNVLNYLSVQPEQITAVDLNPYHMYLTRLRLAALEHLPTYEDFFRFFAIAEDKRNIENYLEFIKPHLDEAARHYWEGGAIRPLLGLKRINYFAKNLYNFSRSGYFIRFLHALCKLNGCNPALILNAKSIEEQKLLFDKHLAPTFDHWLVKILGKLPLMFFSLGIPPQQYELMRKETGEEIIELFRERVRHMACDFPIQENYFAWQSFARRYNIANQDGLPLYLQRKNYAVSKAIVNRVSHHVVSYIHFLQLQPKGAFNKFVLLDSQDWMKPPQLVSLWQEIARVGEPGSRVIFRTAAESSPLDQALPVPILSKFQYEAEKSKLGLQQDRSSIYGGFHLYRLRS